VQVRLASILPKDSGVVVGDRVEERALERVRRDNERGRQIFGKILQLCAGADALRRGRKRRAKKDAGEDDDSQQAWGLHADVSFGGGYTTSESPVGRMYAGTAR